MEALCCVMRISFSLPVSTLFTLCRRGCTVSYLQQRHLVLIDPGNKLTVCHVMVRFAIGACSLQDLAQDANVKAILAPTPKSVDRNRSCRRAYLQRFFEVWRAHTAQHASKSRRACNFPQHLLITSSAQFSGEPPALTHTVSQTQCHDSSCLLAVMLIECCDVCLLLLLLETCCFKSMSLAWLLQVKCFCQRLMNVLIICVKNRSGTDHLWAVDELSFLPRAGHIIVAKQDVIATVHGSFLCASLEIGMLRRALMYLCELRQAKPRTMASHHAARADPSLPPQHRPHPYAADSTSGAAGVDLSQTAAGRVFGATTASPWSSKTSGDKTAMTKAVHTTAGKPKRNLTMQVFLHCARIDVSLHFSTCLPAC